MRPTGWVPDTIIGGADLRAVDELAALFGADAPPPEGRIRRDPWVDLDQDGESCTGHFGAQAIYGLTGFKGSPYLPWWFARAYNLGPLEEMPNVGVSASALRLALKQHGTCAWEDWRPGVTGFSIDQKPPGLARMSAQKRNLKVVSILDLGRSAVDAVCLSIERGFPVGVVVQVDGEFERFDGDGVIHAAAGRVNGLHIVTGWAFRTVQGRREIQIVNSWGRWGDNNTAWLDESRIRNAPYLCAAVEVS